MDPKRIILIEDEEDVAMLLTSFLEKQGFKTKVEKNGAAGAKLIKSDKPDLVILDIMLPGMNGFDVLLKIKSEQQTQGIPVVMCTALNGMNEVEKCCAWGADGYIVKPFDLERVLAKINNILEPGTHPIPPA